MMGKLEPAVSFAACSVMQCPFVPSPPCQVNDGALRDGQGTFSRVGHNWKTHDSCAFDVPLTIL